MNILPKRCYIPLKFSRAGYARRWACLRVSTSGIPEELKAPAACPAERPPYVGIDN